MILPRYRGHLEESIYCHSRRMILWAAAKGYLNRAETDLNIIVGLCVGHDILFTKYSDAPVTTLVVKDRVAGHNPVSVLYGQNFYYKRLKKQPVMPDQNNSNK